MIKLPGSGLQRYSRRCKAKIQDLSDKTDEMLHQNIRGPIVDFAYNRTSSDFIRIIRYLDDTVDVEMTGKPVRTIDIGAHKIQLDTRYNMFGLKENHIDAWFFRGDPREDPKSDSEPCDFEIDHSEWPMMHQLGPQEAVLYQTVPKLREIPILMKLDGPVSHLGRGKGNFTIACVGSTVHIYNKHGDAEYKRSRRYSSPIKTIYFRRNPIRGLEYALLETNGQLWIEQCLCREQDVGPKLFYGGVSEIFFCSHLAALCKDGRILDWRSQEIFNQTYTSGNDRMICARPSVIKPEGLVLFIQSNYHTLYGLCA